MPKQQQYKIVKAAFAAIFVIFSYFVAVPSFSASLGRLVVLSSLGQPLRAEVELLDTESKNLSTLKVSLAPLEAYKLSGIDYASLLQSLKINVESDAGRSFVSIRSLQPVNEPYIGLLLELDTGDERKENEYFIMLDPEEWTNLRSAPLSSAASIENLARQQKEGRKFSQISSAVASPSAVLKKQEPKTTEKQQSIAQQEKKLKSEYKVSRGDSLSKIAMRLGYKDISLEQMLLLLYRNNPDAFLNENMNLLKEGAILSLPDITKGTDTSQKEAQAVVKLHAENFREYGLKLAEIAQKTTSRANSQTTAVSQGKITTKVKEKPTPLNQLPDRLELSKASPDLKSKEISTEEKIAFNKAIEDTNQRITELEKNVNELRSLLNVISNKGKNLVNPAETVVSKKKNETKRKDKAGNKDKVSSPIEEIKTGSSSEEQVISAEKTVDSKGIEEDEKTDKQNAQEEKSEVDEDNNEDEAELKTDKKTSFLQKLQTNTVWQIAVAGAVALFILIILLLKIKSNKKKSPKAKSFSAVKEKVEEVNSNVSSGRDYLESLTKEEVLEDLNSNDLKDRKEIIEQELDGENSLKDQEFQDISFISVDSATLNDSFQIDEDNLESENILAEEKETKERTYFEEGIQFKEISSSSLFQQDDFIEDSDQTLEKSIDFELPSLELNLSDINLELENENAISEKKVLSDIEADDMYNAEMAAKLELAFAYIDMKDVDGARELLEEVVARGTPGQVLEAEKALQSL